MKSILRSLAVLAVLVGFTSSSFAQDDNDIIRPITKQGSAAFLMTIGGLGTFNLASPPIGPGLSQSGFGFKYFLADDVALRVLLGIGMNSTTIPGVGDADDVTQDTTAIGLGVGAEYHFRPLYSTSPYIGAQVGFVSVSSNNGLDGDQEVSMSQTHISVAAIAGFNWFFTRGIAVGGEYSLGFTGTTGTRTSGGEENDLNSNSMIGVSGVGSVNLVVYF